MSMKNEGKWETGRGRYLEADTNYQPTKYKNSVRFDMSKLVDTKEFDRYLPYDMCRVNVIIPINALNKDTIAIPVVVNCDQGGGTVTMDCALSNKKSR